MILVKLVVVKNLLLSVMGIYLLITLEIKSEIENVKTNYLHQRQQP